VIAVLLDRADGQQHDRILLDDAAPVFIPTHLGHQA